MAKKSPAQKRATAKRKTAKATKKTAAKKSVAKGRTKAASKKTTKKPAKSLGRARIPADAKLDLIFKKDYEARQVFTFLGVTTVRELEAYRADQIIEILTAPMVQTVERIRKAMAMNNRCLAGDLRFALKFQSQLKRGK